MTDSNYLLDLSSYVPNIVKQKLIDHSEISNQASIEHFEGAVLFADISGFTALTEQIATQGPEGVETITHILNAYFTRMLETIHAHGGDVVKFAGDALLAIWREDQQENAYPLAAACALTLQEQLHQYSPAENVFLRMRIGLGAGQTIIACVGGLMQRWDVVVAGSALAQASLAQVNARPGQVFASAEMRQALAQNAAFNGGILLALRAPVSTLDVSMTIPLISSDQVSALQSYIPTAITSRLSVGQAAWMAELRRVTVLFIELPDFTQTEQSDSVQLEKTQTMLQSVQEILYSYEGSPNKISVDEKGMTLLAAMGLPPFSHADDPLRAVLAALDIVAKMEALGLRCRVGIATGRAYCGSIGSSRRREYTMIGKVVNLAARLKVAAEMDETNLNIFCDTATADASNKRIAYHTLPPVMVKGIDKPVPVYCPIERLQSIKHASDYLVGRAAERTILLEHLSALKQGKGQVLILEGDAGMGKSRLVDDLLQNADHANVKILVGAGDAIEKSSSYHPWRPIFRQLFELENALTGIEAGRQRSLSLNGEQVQGILASFAQRLPDMLDRAPLLNAILPINLPDNDLTRQMQGQLRADDTKRLLVSLLKRTSEITPILLILEDAHWLDSASWALARAVVEELPHIYLVIATRPLGDAPPVDYKKLLDTPGIEFINLQLLSSEDTLDLVCMRLGVRLLPPVISNLIMQKTDGHPFFSEELAYALRDTHLIEIENGECLVKASFEELNSFIPNTIEGVITSRIDRLTPQEQLTLKVASVLGRVFALSALRAVHPIDLDRPLLESYLESLGQLDLTILNTSDPDLTYIFKHVITQEVAYNLMLFTQRKQLHRTVAEWYERTYADDLAPYFPVLAHHYTHAEDPIKTIEYLVKAGEQSLLQFANQEAIRFLSEALHLVAADEPRTLEAKLERALWERWLGQAYLRIGNLPQAKAHLYLSLVWLNCPMPTTSFGSITVTLQQFALQMLHVAFPRFFVVSPGGAPAPSPAERKRLMAIYTAYEMLSELFYFSSDRIRLVIAGLYAVNISERLPLFVGRAQALIGLSIVMSTLGLKKLATRYQTQALAIIEKSDDLIAANRVKLVADLYRLGNAGTNHTIQTELSELDESYQILGDRRRWGDARTLHCLSYFYDGQYEENLALGNDFYMQLQRTNEMQQKVWAIQAISRSFIIMGRAREAIEILTEAKTYLAHNIDRVSEVTVTGLLCRAYWQTGQREKAREAIELGVSFVQGPPLATFAVQVGFEHLTNTILEMLEEQSAQGQKADEQLHQLLKKLLPISQRFARAFPIHAASFYRSKGLDLWLMGNPKAARIAWQKSLELARQYHLPYAEGMAFFELGRHAEGAPRLEYLSQARVILEKIKATYDLQRIPLS